MSKRKGRSRSARFRKRVLSLLEADPDMGTKEILARTKRFALAASSKRREIGKVKREYGYEISPRAPTRAKELSLARRMAQVREWGATHSVPDELRRRARDYNTGKGLLLNDKEGLLYALGLYLGKTREEAKLDAIEGTL